MASVINIAPAGALTQGQILFSLDFGTGGVWDVAICKLNSMNVLFGRYKPSGGSYGSWAPFNNTLLSNSGWLDDASIKTYAQTLVPFALPSTSTVGLTYAADTATQTGLYADGKGVISTAPATVQTTTDVIKQILTGSTDSTTGGTDTTVKKWYQKPLFWVLTAIGTIGTIWYLKSK